MEAGGPLGWEAGERLLTGDDRVRYERLVRIADRHRHAVSRAALYALLSERWGITEQVLHRLGQPPILPGAHHVNLSLAHSGDLVVCAASDGPVGVDVEESEPSESFAGAIERALCPSEHRYAERSALPEATRMRLWARKEAVIKARGAPDLAAMSRIAARHRFVRVERWSDVWRLHDIRTPPSYVGAAAVAPGSRLVVETPHLHPEPGK